MEIYIQILAVLDSMMTLFTGVFGNASGSFMGVDGSFFDFAVQASKATMCTEKSCPGSFYTAIATAWANIGYLTHADVLEFLRTTHFGKWAILLYIGAAITGLLGVATNSPMRNYTWFFIGPALFSFLVGTTMKVQGVNWVIANKAVSREGMEEVWRNAEAGLANTQHVQKGKIKIKGKDGPDREYEVAMPMVFLDELFSATTNLLIQWTGIGNQVDNGGGNSNLSVRSNNDKKAWWLLTNMKWGYIENITGATIRNPDLRDALITFLASECGDLFKQGIDSASYIASTQARGKTVVKTVMKNNQNLDYADFKNLLGNVFIPTPRSLSRLYKEKNNASGKAGSFMNFSSRLEKALETGRTHAVVCSEYLWTIIQGLRFEAGSAYYQMIRSAPTGFDEDSFVETLIYGWDAREAQNKDMTPEDQKAFLKHLILTYILRNELISAPQITTIDQRYAPAEQAKSYSEANIRSFGAKAKFIEFYNAAVMMPYLQGILAYFLIVSYPLACMLVILPGHYKGFFTWVAFFAWIKLWDVGFAMVHVLERSVWAMIGNHAHMAATARTLIETAKKVGGIGADAPSGANPLTSTQPQDAVPIVCALAEGIVDGKCPGGPGAEQKFTHAFELFDKLLLTGANIDLDLSNGWYIYIMAALYTAVPAVTGQIVLGAKAGSASLVKDAFQGVANDGGQAAKTGAQHAAVNALQTNQKSIGQMAMAKALRKGTGADGQGPSLAAQSFMDGVKSSQLGVDNAGMEGRKDFLNTKANLGKGTEQSYARGAAMFKAAYGALDSTLGEKYFPSTKKDGNGETDPTKAGTLRKYANGAGDTADAAARVSLGRRSDEMALDSATQGQDWGWEIKANGLQQGALKDSAGKLASMADFDAQSAAWEAKNEFAAHASAVGGIAGMNSGSLVAGDKPAQMEQMAVAGMLDGYTAIPDGKGGVFGVNNDNNASNAAWYSKEGLPGAINTMRDKGIAEAGGAGLTKSWNEGGGYYSAFGSADEARKSVFQGKNYFNEADVKRAEDMGKDVGDVMTGISNKVHGTVDHLPNLPELFKKDSKK